MLLQACLALAIAAAAGLWPDCARTGKPPRDRPFLREVLACQDRIRAKLRKTRRPSNAEWDSLDAHQRAEVRDYINRQTSPVQGDGAAPQAAAERSPLGGPTDADLRRVDPETVLDLAELQRQVHAAAGDGRQGVTPQMARDMEDFLLKEQGQVSPEMSELLRAVSKDGGKLTDDTMKKLGDAARAAKAEGLDLNVKPEIEKGLLEFKPGQDGSSQSQQDPGSL